MWPVGELAKGPARRKLARRRRGGAMAADAESAETPSFVVVGEVDWRSRQKILPREIA